MRTNETANASAKSPTRRRFAPKRLTAALAGCALISLPLARATAQTLPSGLSVASGQAQVNTVGNRMTVVNSPQAVLNWNSFSIGANQSVYFQQANASSQVLNRVVGNDPSQILGSLGSNGRVWLLNPNGVLFGQHARVDVAGLVASTLRLPDTDWLAGRYRFEGAGEAAAGVVNRGELRASFGGTIALVGGDVRNEGLVQGPGGQVILAAGRSVELVDTGAPNLAVRITAAGGEARNLGQLHAAGGRIDIHAAAVNQQGIVSADGFATGSGGEVWIKASQSAELGAGSRTSADGASGGSVQVASEAGRSTVAGSLSAQGAQGHGGQAVLLGREIALLDGSQVNASGATGGGEVVVGGGERGQDARYANAQGLYFAPGASIAADARAQGDGGRIVLWSDRATRAFGSLSARGGALAGQGGFIETSGGWLDARPARVDLGAPAGRSGNWLLDPYDITISDAGPDAGFNASFTATADTATISSATIRNALLAGTHVTISTGGSAGSQQGDITVSSANLTTIPSGPALGHLSLVADRNITINGSSLGGGSSGNSNVTLTAGQSGSGTVTVSNSTINTAGQIRIAADNVLLLGSSYVTSWCTGDAIVFSGRNNGPMSVFTNTTASGSISASLGRWIVYFDNISSSTFSPGTLDFYYNFKRHGASYGAWSGDSGNGYVFAAQKTAVVAGTVQNRTYDGTVNAVSQGDTTVTGLVSGDYYSVAANPSVSFADKNAGVGKLATFNSPSAVSFYDSNSAPVYGYTLNGGLTGTVSPATVTGSATGALSKVYDGTTSASVTMSALTGLIGTEQVLVVAAATYDNKNVGTNKPVSVTGYALQDGGNGGLAINYTFVPATTPPPTFTASITPRPLTITGLAINDKVYDGSTAATLASAPVLDAVPGDLVSLGTVSASFNDKHAGVNKAVTVTGLAVSGPDAANYQVQPSASGFTATITPRPLDVSGLSVANKVYDGTTAAQLTGAVALNVVAGDQVTLNGAATAQFVDKNAGQGKAIVLGGITLTGPDAGNYAASPAQGLSADIAPKVVSVSGASVANKVYDGTVLATLSGTPTVEVLSGDSVALGGTVLAQFSDKNVGSAKPVGVSGYALTGPDAGNYLLEQPKGLTANITPRDLVLGGFSVSDKVYDGSTAATLSSNISLNPVAGDVVTLTGTPVAQFADKNVGHDKPVTVTGYGLGGADAGNYTLGPATGITADITPRPLTLSGLTALSKVYDGTTSAQLSGTASINALPGDSVSTSGTLVGTFSDKHVGQGKLVTISDANLSGADAGNYTLVSANGLFASITPRPLALVGLSAADKVYDGTKSATLVGTAAFNSLAGDDITLTGNVSGSFADKNVGAGKLVTVSGFAAAGADAGNYALQPSTTLQASITPRGVALTGLGASNKVYDGSTAATLTGSAQAQTLAGDAVALAGSGTGSFADRHVGTAKPVQVAGFTLSGADAANYTLLQPVGLVANITPATLLYVATPEARNIGRPLDGLTGTITGFMPGDTVANATQGNAAFSTPATPSSPPGSYPVTGSGLSAQNYLFAQAGTNAQALTLVADLNPVTTAVVGSDGISGPAIGTGFKVITATTGGERRSADTGMLDLSSGNGNVSGVAGAGTGSGRSGGASNADFQPVKLSALSTDELQSLLANRQLFMQNLLADAVAQLERNPALADMRECRTLREAEHGECLITAALKDQAAARPAVPGLSTAAASPPVRVPEAAATPAMPAAPAAAAPTASPASPPVLAAPAAPAPAMPAAPAATGAPLAAAAPPSLPPEVLQLSPQAPPRKVRSASLPQIERKIALVVGVDRYADSSIPALNNAVRDARAVARIFESRLGYEAVVLENATKPALVAALNRLALSVGPRDSVVVYYAGHGELVEATKLGYWLLSDSRAKQPESWLSNTDINRLVAQIGASQVALVSDSCYSGSLATEERIRPQAAAPNPQLILERKSVVVMSSGGNEPVFDEGKDGHSPFAYNLMNVLGQVSNWQAGGNVFERVRFAVARSLPQRPQYSASRAAGHQSGGDYLFEQRQLDARP